MFLANIVGIFMFMLCSDEKQVGDANPKRSLLIASHNLTRWGLARECFSKINDAPAIRPIDCFVSDT